MEDGGEVVNARGIGRVIDLRRGVEWRGVEGRGGTGSRDEQNPIARSLLS